MNPTHSARTFLKHALCAAYKYSGAAFLQEVLAERAGCSRLPILLFHRVSDEIAPDGITVGTAYFRRVCRMLQRRFRVVPLGEVFRLARSGRPLPRRTVAITFDDCYRDNLDAARVLAEHGLPACFFVPAAWVGTEHTFPWDRHLKRLTNLTWDEVRQIAALGHEIGSHTLTHPDLGATSLAQARLEICESKKVIEQQVGRPVRWFAYPFGGRQNFRDELLPLLVEAGYEGCLSAHGGFVSAGTTGLMLPRQAVLYFDEVPKLELFLSGALDWFYRLKRRPGGQESTAPRQESPGPLETAHTH